MSGVVAKLQNQEYRPGFDQRRVVVLPSNVIKRCRQLPVVRNLYVTNIGSMEALSTHRVDREEGVKQAIFLFCIAGRGYLELGNSAHIIRAGSGFFVPPDVAHTYGAHHRDPWVNFWFHFDGPLVDEVLELYGSDALNPTIHLRDIQKIMDLFENVYACLNYHHSDSGLMRMNSEFMRLLGFLDMNRVPQFKQSRLSNGKIEHTIRFMESNLNIEIDLEMLAELADKSKSHYSKLFKELTGEPPVRFFNRLRIRKACELLDHSEMQIRDIGKTLGYDDPYYFSRAFKSIQGVSPEAYRKSIKG